MKKLILALALALTAGLIAPAAFAMRQEYRCWTNPNVPYTYTECGYVTVQDDPPTPLGPGGCGLCVTNPRPNPDIVTPDCYDEQMSCSRTLANGTVQRGSGTCRICSGGELSLTSSTGPGCTLNETIFTMTKGGIEYNCKAPAINRGCGLLSSYIGSASAAASSWRMADFSASNAVSNTGLASSGGTSVPDYCTPKGEPICTPGAKRYALCGECGTVTFTCNSTGMAETNSGCDTL